MTLSTGAETAVEYPVTLRRRVAWGECDPAGVVYTPVFSEYAVSAFQAFLACVLGDPLQEQLRRMDLRTPVRALSFDFQRSLYPDQWFDMSVWLCEIRGTTFAIQVVATDLQNQVVMTADLTAICTHHDERKSRPVPPELRERLEAYRKRCATGEGASA
jgi:acyl-CoA thioester hydrolase